VVIFGFPSSAQKSARLLGDPFGLGHEGQMSAARKGDDSRIRNAVAQIGEAARRYQQIAVASHEQRGNANALHAAIQAEPLGEVEPVRHHALVRLPALSSDEMEERSRFLLAAEQEIEELIDERTVVGQRIAGKDHSGHLLQQAALKPGTRSLDHKFAEPKRKAGSK